MTVLSLLIKLWLSSHFFLSHRKLTQETLQTSPYGFFVGYQCNRLGIDSNSRPFPLFILYFVYPVLINFPKLVITFWKNGSLSIIFSRGTYTCLRGADNKKQSGPKTLGYREYDHAKNELDLDVHMINLHTNFFSEGATFAKRMNRNCKKL